MVEGCYHDSGISKFEEFMSSPWKTSESLAIMRMISTRVTKFTIQFILHGHTDFSESYQELVLQIKQLVLCVELDQASPSKTN